MLFVLITLLLVAGMLILGMERDELVAAIVLWIAGWFVVRIVGNRLDTVRKHSQARWESLLAEAEHRLKPYLSDSIKYDQRCREFCRIATSVFEYKCAAIGERQGEWFRIVASSGEGAESYEGKFLKLGSDIESTLLDCRDFLDLDALLVKPEDDETETIKVDADIACPLRRGSTVAGIVIACIEGERILFRERNLVGLSCMAAKWLLTEASDANQSASTDESRQVRKSSVVELRGSRVLRDYFDVTSKLFKIFNIDLLFERFVLSAQKLLRAEYCCLYLPRESDNLTVAFSAGNIPDGIMAHSIRTTAAVCDLLRRHPGSYTVSELADLSGEDQEMRYLRKLDVDAIIPVALPDSELGLLAVSRRSDHMSSYSFDDREMIYTLCQTVELISENIHQFKKIEELSYTDSLTKLYNYRYFYRRVSEELLRAKRFNRYLALAVFDIDEFKVFNDTFGHQTGDDILRQLGDLLRESVRSIDIVCRYGGEEFCVIMPESNRRSCEQFMDRLRRAIAKHVFFGRFSDHEHCITVSAGGSIFPADAIRVDRLIYCADMALLSAKRSGRNRCVMYEDSVDDMDAAKLH
jgi:diguanylate cyclase (GGDEF)-like protein